MKQILNIGNDQLELSQQNANGIWRAKIVINRIDIIACIETAKAIEKQVGYTLDLYNNNDPDDEHIILKKEKK